MQNTPLQQPAHAPQVEEFWHWPPLQVPLQAAQAAPPLPQAASLCWETVRHWPFSQHPRQLAALQPTPPTHVPLTQVPPTLQGAQVRPLVPQAESR